MKEIAYAIMTIGIDESFYSSERGLYLNHCIGVSIGPQLIFKDYDDLW